MSTGDTSLGAGQPVVLGARVRFDGWTIGPYLAAAIVALPIVTVVGVAFFPEDENVWLHLLSTVLPVYAWNTLLLILGVGIGVCVIGIGTAWLVTMCRVPGRHILEWALLLPLAMPAYVIAYVYTDLLEFAGPLQAFLRGVFGWHSARDYWFPEIRSMGGAIAMFSLVLYPYVYLLSRAAFVEQSVGQLEVSRTLGRGAWQTFYSVALPLARPSIVIGLTLALMEVLNDLGTVEFFAVNTFTRGDFQCLVRDEQCLGRSTDRNGAADRRAGDPGCRASLATQSAVQGVLRDLSRSSVLPTQSHASDLRSSSLRNTASTGVHIARVGSCGLRDRVLRRVFGGELLAICGQ